MKILITPLFGIGDILMTTPALEVLKKSRPDYRLTYFVMKKVHLDILKGNPYVDEIIYYPLAEASKLKGLLFLLKKISGRFDVSLNFYPSNRKDYNLFSFLTLAGTRIGHRYIHDDFKELNWLKNRTIRETPDLHNIEENIRLLELLGIRHSGEIPSMKIYLGEKEIEQGKRFVEKFSGKKKIGIHAGSSLFKNHINRRLPKEKFLEVIKVLPEYTFFLFGGKEEEEENRFLSENAPNTVWVKEKNIREVASIIANLDTFVSNDSGLMHLAVAAGVPVIAIFGPTNWNLVGPKGDKHSIIKPDIECAPCFYYSSRPLQCKTGKNFACIKEIPTAKVVEEILKLA